MVATSQPLATRAGLRALERGGNAADAALAAAAVCCVAEPMSTGIGGDAFALVWHDGQLSALDAAGPAPARADASAPVEPRGPRSVTVPGAVAGWVELAERHGRLGLEACLADAIDAAERGVAVAPRTAALWAAADAPRELGPVPRVGERFRLPELGATLRAVAADGRGAFYDGSVAQAIAAVSWLEEADLSAYRPRWVEPLRLSYRDVDVVELPPPTQGVAALEALGLLERSDATDLATRIDCVRLALEDALAQVRDGADVRGLLANDHLDQRLRGLPRRVAEPAGGTVYLCVVDRDRMAVSFIQSLYEGFGSGVVAPGTGVVLQNRGACFAVNGSVEPGRRPYHTLVPALLLRNGGLVGPFGVMGGFIQAQAHVQLVCALVDEALDPQAALERPRFRVEDDAVRLEEGLWHEAAALEARGFRVIREDDWAAFGGGQAILVRGDALLGGSDPRKDGYAGGL